MNRHHQKMEVKLQKEEADKIGRGGALFSGRGCMSSGTQRSWHLEGGRMNLSHGPLQTTVSTKIGAILERSSLRTITTSIGGSARLF
jgi:hypothetical protein